MNSFEIFSACLLAVGIIMFFLVAYLINKPRLKQVHGKIWQGLALLVKIAVLLSAALAIVMGIDFLMPPAWGFNGAKTWLMGIPLVIVVAIYPWIKSACGDVGMIAASTAHQMPQSSMPESSGTAQFKKKQAWPHAGLMAGLQSIRLNRAARAKKMTRILLVFALPCALILGAIKGPMIAGIIVLAALVLISQWVQSIGGVNQFEYHTLPGSKDEFGKQRCVYCGRSGVYRQGAYASNSTWHQCTGCRKHLFVN
jgi:hypothetical protein